MKFGQVEDPSQIDFSLPPDHKDTRALLESIDQDFEGNGKKTRIEVYVGCAKWNRADLKGFYPRGTKDELEYYSRQFNSIELNATFYRLFPKEQFEKWYTKTPIGFKFFPKITNYISHMKRLIDSDQFIPEYVEHTSLLKEKLGTVFLQMHNNFQPKNFDRVDHFVNHWPEDVPLAMEFRHTDWFNDGKTADRLYHLLEEHNIANVLVDTAGRRDIMHMRLTNNEAFIRYVGANHPSDYGRLDDWIARLQYWVSLGLQKIHFFIHQNVERESPLLSAYFIQKLNAALGTTIFVPNDSTNIAQTL
jgi:uncharacterized protein YecE (DUF72 family)